MATFKYVIHVVKRLGQISLDHASGDLHLRLFPSLSVSVGVRLPNKTITTTLLWTPAQRKRASMLYFANVFFIYFFMAALFSGPG